MAKEKLKSRYESQALKQAVNDAYKKASFHLYDSTKVQQQSNTGGKKIIIVKK